VAGAGKRGGGLGVGHPYQPAQLPGPEVVLHRADDPLVTLVAGNVQQRTGMPTRVTAIAITT
jgi:hypothetical protein